MIKHKIILTTLTVLLFLTTGTAQDRTPAFEINERLGRGINLGNCLEAPSEGEWGYPWEAEYFEIMAELGFDHVRLPVRWEPADRSMATSPYTINQTFLNHIKEIVDNALENKLQIIVNMHHHEALYDDPAGQKERFLSQWNQIATFFQDYPDSLLFEVLNEPHGNVTPELWNDFFADALTEIRKTNPTRAVLLGVAEFGGLGGIVHLDLPADEYIILSPHYYNPFSFTHQGAEWVDDSDPWLGTEWHDTDVNRETVENEFKFALQFSADNHIPIHVGEFGAYSKADIESRERWTTFLARWFEQQGMSWAYWEFNAGFGIYNPDTKEYLNPLVDALLHNEMPEPTPVYPTPIYTSDFSTSTDGWSLNTQSGASGSLSVAGGKLNVSLANGGTESWHAQLVKNNIEIKKDSMYRVSFKAEASHGRSINSYIGKASDPWNAYSGYNGISIGTTQDTYSYSFTMNENTDPSARIVFDLGKSDADISITDVKVELISFHNPDNPVPPVTGLEEENLKKVLEFYPNPVVSQLYIPDLPNYDQLEFIDLNGRKILNIDIRPSQTSVDMQNLPRGIYLVRLTGNGMEDRLKVVKE